MSKTIIFNKEAREALQRGSDTLANAVKVTLGPKGRNVIIGKQFGPHSTKDGVTVAQYIKVADPIENLGVQLLQEIATKTLEISGDGTTTACVLAQAIINEGILQLNNNVNPIKLKKGIELATIDVVNYLKSISKPIIDSSIEQIATISANNDSEIGSLIANAVTKVGTEGLITVEESRSTETYIEVTEGMRVDKGYISPYFVTDSNKMVVEYEDVAILVTDEKITDITTIKPIVEAVMQKGKALLIICDDLADEALATLVVNKMKGNLKIAAIKAPSFGDHQRELLQDICVLTGATLISKEKGLSLETTTVSQVGLVDKIKINKDSTTLVGGKGDKELIQVRINQIKSQVEVAETIYDKEKLTKRSQKLSGGAAILYVGATTESELKEKKDRIDDALCATKAAIEEGIIPGGGSAYLKSLPFITDSKDKDIQVGISIVKKALETPLKQILQNGGIEPTVIISKVKKGKLGYNAKLDVFQDLLANGVIDPTKVARIALENASSIAALFLITECVVIPEQKELPY